MSGHDLSACIARGEDGPKFTFAFDNVYKDGSGCGQVMARSDRHKLIRYDVDDPKLTHVLYDMEGDPAETRSLALDPAYAEVVREHDAAIDAFLAGMRAPLYPVRTVREDPELAGGLSRASSAVRAAADD